MRGITLCGVVGFALRLPTAQDDQQDDTDMFFPRFHFHSPVPFIFGGTVFDSTSYNGRGGVRLQKKAQNWKMNAFFRLSTEVRLRDPGAFSDEEDHKSSGAFILLLGQLDELAKPVDPDIGDQSLGLGGNRKVQYALPRPVSGQLGRCGNCRRLLPTTCLGETHILPLCGCRGFARNPPAPAQSFPAAGNAFRVHNSSTSCGG